MLYMNGVYGYGPNAHRHLTLEAIEYANTISILPKEYRDELKEFGEYLTLGSIEEDMDSARLVGGYCPGGDATLLSAAGNTGKIIGIKVGKSHGYCRHFLKSVNQEASINSIGFTANPFIKPYDNSPYWENSFKGWGDVIWQAAIDKYNKGDKEGAFIELGKLSHLIQDLSVPAHTHDDVHPPKIFCVRGLGSDYCPDSYEEYMAKPRNYKRYTADLIPSRKYENIKIPIKDKRKALFNIFHDTAEKADDYPSDDVPGEKSDNSVAERINKRWYERYGDEK